MKYCRTAKKIIPKQEEKTTKKSFPAVIGLAFHQEQLEEKNKYLAT
jgi:hypothetical protein